MSNAALSVIEMTTRAIYARWQLTKLQTNESSSDLAQVLSAEAGTIQWVFLPRLLNLSSAGRAS